MVRTMQAQKKRGVDLETTGLRYKSGAHPIGFSTGYLDRHLVAHCWYVPVAHQTMERMVPADKARQAFHDATWGAEEYVGHNLKFDKNMGRANGYNLNPLVDVHDSLVQGYILYERRAFALEALVNELGISPWGDANQMKNKVEAITQARANERKLPYKKDTPKHQKWCYLSLYGHAEVPVDIEAEYSCRDIAHTLLLDHHQRSAAMGLGTEFEERRRYLYRMEMSLVSALAEMEWIGQRVDVDYLRTFGRELDVEMDVLGRQLRGLFGLQIDWGNDTQVRELIYGRIGFPVLGYTEKGLPSVEQGVLMRLGKIYPEWADPLTVLVEWKVRRKVRDTYTESLIHWVDDDGRIHGSTHQWGTETGRLSSSSPNLQNIPTRHAVGKKIRRAFICEEGQSRVFGDYSQIELRFLAWATGCKTLLDAYASPAYDRYVAGEVDYDAYLALRKVEPSRDVHSEVAMKTFHCTEAHPDWSRKRRGAKIINFSVPYGGTHMVLMENPELLLPEAEAVEYYETYHRQNPEIRAAQQALTRLTLTRKHCRFVNWMGRYRHMPALRSSDRKLQNEAGRQLFASAIQGGASELTKISLVRQYECYLRGEMPMSSNTIHDELQTDCPTSEKVYVARKKRAIMEDFRGYFGRVPVVVEMEATDTNWAEKKAIEEMH